MLLDANQIQLSSVRFENNTAVNGGALWSKGNPLNKHQISIQSSSFSNNKALKNDNFYEGGYGGAIYAYGPGNITIDDSVFTSNEASFRGGALYEDYGAKYVVTNSQFERNSAVYGGAIFGEDRNSQTSGTFPSLVAMYIFC